MILKGKSKMTTSFRADLHCHSTCSDGSLSPAELVEQACQIGLLGLSITDHDTLAAYETALPEAKRRGLSMISGVEISAAHHKASVHILGYAFSLGQTPIRELCKRQKAWRTERNAKILELLNQRGMPLSLEDLAAVETRSIGRPHLAFAMVAKGYVSSLEEAFQLYLGEGKPCYYGEGKPSVQETIETIQASGGVAILAHPHLIRDARLIKDLVRYSFDGLEGYYAKIPSAQEKRWLQLAKDKGWMVTGGSDFHGECRPSISLGDSWTKEETFLKLLQRFEASL